VQEKSNEITAIPELLKSFNIKGHILTTDAMGYQTETARLIRKGQAHYILGLKGNQGTLHEEVKQYFDGPKLLSTCAYHKVIDKAQSAVEIREYRQTTDIARLK
jgi:predicted transposase YbfD/YdcC